MSKRTIQVKGTTISVDDRDYISLSDICEGFEAGTALIQSWMRTRTTVEFLGVWERLFNPDFNSIEFDRIKNESGSNTFILSVKKWDDFTGAIGITSRAGRYGAGVFAHSDIAAHFCAWLSPEFHLLLIREFQRLKTIESGEWQLHRELAKINYPLHTAAVKGLIEQKRAFRPLPKSAESQIYASEADVLNMALFGCTAEQWRAVNPDSRGNIRDHASIIELHVLANMESYNAILLRNGLPQWQRINELTRTAVEQMKIFEETNIAAIRRLKNAASKTEPTDKRLPGKVKD
ncbi:MAG: KilA-N domain-containing protein [Saprospiraceae bacterium]